jgi:hypothetical protein
MAYPSAAAVMLLQLVRSLLWLGAEVMAVLCLVKVLGARWVRWAVVVLGLVVLLTDVGPAVSRVALKVGGTEQREWLDVGISVVSGLGRGAMLWVVWVLLGNKGGSIGEGKEEQGIGRGVSVGGPLEYERPGAVAAGGLPGVMVVVWMVLVCLSRGMIYWEQIAGHSGPVNVYVGAAVVRLAASLMVGVGLVLIWTMGKRLGEEWGLARWTERLALGVAVVTALRELVYLYSIVHRAGGEASMVLKFSDLSGAGMDVAWSVCFWWNVHLAIRVVMESPPGWAIPVAALPVREVTEGDALGGGDAAVGG